MDSTVNSKNMLESIQKEILSQVIDFHRYKLEYQGLLIREVITIFYENSTRQNTALE